MTFGDWDETLHRDPDQIVKRKNSKSVVLKDIDRETGSALAVGSADEPYVVTLNECTCGSFKTGKPCKHMYRLASELGLIEDLPEPNREAAKAFKENLPSEIKHFEDLYFRGAISAEKYAAIAKALKK
ncbi:MAG: SWIM zinc finger domain-containing protein [Lachnospiraceae bacterium]|nr:SWIM zinc finger domain-containing protein [Lachnospiraceae bacterium]